MEKIKLLLVDDQKMVREGLRLILDRYEKFDFVGEAANGFEAIQMTKKHLPDVVLMDLRMPEMNGIDTQILCDGKKYGYQDHDGRRGVKD